MWVQAGGGGGGEEEEVAEEAKSGVCENDWKPLDGIMGVQSPALCFECLGISPNKRF